MGSQRESGLRLFQNRLEDIEGAIETVCRRKGLESDEAQELYSLSMMKIVDDDFAALRTFQGRSSWRTYLTVVVCRVLLDDRSRRWGRWRPSTAAQRLGQTAIRLERRLSREGWSVPEAVADLRMRGVEESAGQLEAMAARLPIRRPRRFSSAEPLLNSLVGKEVAADRLESEESGQAAATVEQVLMSVLDDLPDVDQRLLELRFAHGWTVKRIAESEDLPTRPLYSRFERLLGRLKKRLETSGVRWEMVCQAMHSDVDIGFGDGTF